MSSEATVVFLDEAHIHVVALELVGQCLCLLSNYRAWNTINIDKITTATTTL